MLFLLAFIVVAFVAIVRRQPASFWMCFVLAVVAWGASDLIYAANRQTLDSTHSVALFALGRLVPVLLLAVSWRWRPHWSQEKREPEIERPRQPTAHELHRARQAEEWREQLRQEIARKSQQQ